MYFVPKLQWLVAAVLVAACSAQPIALDACGAACERAQHARSAAAPPCHHEAPAAGQIGQTTRRCGQDHAVAPAASDTGAPGHVQTIASVTPRAFASGPSPSAISAASGSHRPPHLLFALESNTPLRI
jgi:hypothetical protein